MNIELEIGMIDGIRIEMVDISDHFEKAVVRYEYPFADGADLEDLGLKAGTLKCRCYFFDNAAQQTYNDHIALLELLKKKDDRDFLHPKYGVLKGKIESIDVRHDERRRCAEIDFTFIKRGAASIEESISVAVQENIESLFIRNVQECFTNLSAPKPRLPVKPTSFLRSISSAMGRFNALATDITQPVNSLVSTINYATSLPGQLLGTVDRCVERVARLYDTIKQSPARFLRSMEFGLKKIEHDLDSFLPDDRHGAKKTVMTQLRTASARRLALETAIVHAADQEARRVQKSQGTTASFSTNGVYTAPVLPEVAPLNVTELEDTLAMVRTRLQAAIDEDRSMDSLKSMALVLQSSVDQVKSSSERIVTVTVDAPIPLHVLCLRSGLPYSDAERIMALNPKLRRPNFTSDEVQVYGR